jgi:hypothetical protein
VAGRRGKAGSDGKGKGESQRARIEHAAGLGAVGQRV